VASEKREGVAKKMIMAAAENIAIRNDAVTQHQNERACWRASSYNHQHAASSLS